MKRFLFSALLALLTATLSAPAATIADLTAGSLASRLTEADLAASSLVLSGSIDARDFETLKSLPNLKELDLTAVSIAAYMPPKPITAGVAQYEADLLPPMALPGMKLTSLKLPQNLVAIGDNSLSDNAFASISLPSSLTSIGASAFNGCTALTSITLPESVTSLGDYAFSGCSALYTADLSLCALTELPKGAFRNCERLGLVYLPSSLQSIGAEAFAGTSNLKSLDLPTSLLTIGDEAFTLSGLNYIVIPQSVTSIGDFAFARCSDLTQAEIKNPNCTLGRGLFFYDPAFTALYAQGLSIIPDYCFSGNSAFLISNPDSTVPYTQIGDYALLDNPSTQIVLGENLIYLGDGAMEGMTSLNSLDVTRLIDNVPELGTDVWAGVDQSAAFLIVAADTGELWSNADQWKEFTIQQALSVEALPVNGPQTHAWFEDKTLHIASVSEIRDLKIFLSNGSVATALRPNEPQATVDTSDFSDKVYVVVVVCAEKDHNRVFKLIR